MVVTEVLTIARTYIFQSKYAELQSSEATTYEANLGVATGSIDFSLTSLATTTRRPPHSVRPVV